MPTTAQCLNRFTESVTRVARQYDAKRLLRPYAKA